MSRVALVTGGSKGIGAAICRRLASEGLAVAVNYSASADAARSVVAEIEADGGRALALGGDVGDRGHAQRLVAEATDALGPVAVLVNNAGIHKSRPVLKLPPDDWDDVVRVNLSGAFYCTHFALPAMYQAGWGRVVFIGSPVSRTGFPGDASYAATKAGMSAMARCLALETAAYGITVNTVLPGFVVTEMTQSLAPHVFESIAKSQPEVSADDVAAAVAFLCRDEARAVTGEEIAVTGGGPGAMSRRS